MANRRRPLLKALSKHDRAFRLERMRLFGAAKRGGKEAKRILVGQYGIRQLVLDGERII